MHIWQTTLAIKAVQLAADVFETSFDNSFMPD